MAASRVAEPEAGDGARFAGINALRALAALGVLLFHIDLLLPNPIQGIARTLHIGVSLFFVISGFVLFRPFAVALRTGAPVDIRRFLVNRALRILPAYITATLIVWVVLDHAAGLVRLIHNLAFASLYWGMRDEVIVGAWSLDDEVLFYLFLPVLFIVVTQLVPPRWRSRTAVAVILVLGLLSLYYYAGLHLTEPQSNHLSTHTTRFDPWFIVTKFELFVAGMVVAAVHARRGRPLGTGARLAFGGAGAAVLLAGVYAVQNIPGLGDPLVGTGFAGLLAVVVFSDPASAAISVLATPALAFLGEISYGIYIWHAAVIRELLNLRLIGARSPVLVSVPLIIGASLVMASLSYYLVERPALRLKRRWVSPARARP